MLLTGAGTSTHTSVQANFQQQVPGTGLEDCPEGQAAAASCPRAERDGVVAQALSISSSKERASLQGQECVWLCEHTLLHTERVHTPWCNSFSANVIHVHAKGEDTLPMENITCQT